MSSVEENSSNGKKKKNFFKRVGPNFPFIPLTFLFCSLDSDILHTPAPLSSMKMSYRMSRSRTTSKATEEPTAKAIPAAAVSSEVVPASGSIPSDTAMAEGKPRPMPLSPPPLASSSPSATINISGRMYGDGPGNTQTQLQVSHMHCLKCFLYVDHIIHMKKQAPHSRTSLPIWVMYCVPCI